ncbi:MAG: c-type cytochrome domain-containing protein [Halopseudomonas sp.]
MKRIVLIGLCCGALSSWAAPVTYQKQIKPIFAQLCSECHSGWFPEGGLRLDSLDNVREGGSNGVVLFAGEPEKGRLVNFIRVVPGRFSNMPPGPTAVSPEQFELIQQWIEQGAK